MDQASRSLTARLRNEREDGFTLSELIVTIVIMGIVVAAISTALVQALKLPGMSQSRSAIAVQRSYLVQQFSDDVGNATTIFPLLSAASRCPSNPLTIPTPNGTAVPIVQLKWDEPSDIPGAAPQQVDYSVVYKRYNSTFARVEIHRNGTRTGDKVVLSGYCLRTDLNVIGLYSDSLGNFGGSGFPARIEKVTMKVRDNAKDAPITVSLEAAARASCTGANPLLGGC